MACCGERAISWTNVLGINCHPFSPAPQRSPPMHQSLSVLATALVLAATPAAAQAGNWNDPYKPNVAAESRADVDRKVTYFVGTIAAGIAAVVGYQFRRELAEMVSRRRNYHDEEFR